MLRSILRSIPHMLRWFALTLRAGIPPKPKIDTYLTSRLEKFYAEVDSYKPGLTRVEYEEKQQQLVGAAAFQLRC